MPSELARKIEYMVFRPGMGGQAEIRKDFVGLLHLQLATGFKAPTSILCTSIMGTKLETSAACSLRDLAPPWYLALLWARWLINSKLQD